MGLGESLGHRESGEQGMASMLSNYMGALLNQCTDAVAEKGIQVVLVPSPGKKVNDFALPPARYLASSGAVARILSGSRWKSRNFRKST